MRHWRSKKNCPFYSPPPHFLLIFAYFFCEILESFTSFQASNYYIQMNQSERFRGENLFLVELLEAQIYWTGEVELPTDKASFLPFHFNSDSSPHSLTLPSSIILMFTFWGYDSCLLSEGTFSLVIPYRNEWINGGNQLMPGLIEKKRCDSKAKNLPTHRDKKPSCPSSPRRLTASQCFIWPAHLAYRTNQLVNFRHNGLFISISFENLIIDAGADTTSDWGDTV